MSAWVDVLKLPLTGGSHDNRIGRITTLVRELTPYAAIELALPGGSLIALLLWLYRRHRTVSG